MSDRTTSRTSSQRHINPAQRARELYGSAFEFSSEESLNRAMENWRELDPSDQDFVSTHLLYLNIQMMNANIVRLNRIYSAMGELLDAVDTLTDTDLMDEDDEPVEDESEDEPVTDVPPMNDHAPMQATHRTLGERYIDIASLSPQDNVEVSDPLSPMSGAEAAEMHGEADHA